MERIELGLGQLQLRSLRWVLARANRLRRGQVEIPGRLFDAPGTITIPYLYRGEFSGNRPPLLLIHGFGGDKESWLMLATALPRNTPLVILDLPGFGQASPIPGAASSPDRLAMAVAGFVDRLALKRFDLAGNSMGGGVSLRVCRLRPDQVRSLTLINSMGHDPGAALGPSHYQKALERGQNPLIPRNLGDAERMLSLVMTKPPRLPRAILRSAVTDRVAMSSRLQAMFDGWMAAIARSPLAVDLSNLTMPALVVCGERDRVIHPSISRAMAAALPRATLCVLPDVGHLPQLEAPRRTAQFVSRFLATLE